MKSKVVIAKHPSVSYKSVKVEKLNKDELAVIDLISNGFSYSQISKLLSVSLDSIFSTIENIYKKLTKSTGKDTASMFLYMITLRLSGIKEKEYPAKNPIYPAEKHLLFN